MHPVGALFLAAAVLAGAAVLHTNIPGGLENLIPAIRGDFG